MKTVSVTDLKLVSTLSHLNYFEIIDPKNDYLVMPVLEVMGFDVEYPVHVYPAYHRNLQGQCVVGYMYAGELSINKEHLQGVWATTSDRLIGAGYTDKSLAEELMAMNSVCMDYSSIYALEQEKLKDGLAVLTDYEDRVEEERITAEIKQLEELMFLVRGTQRNKYGNYKMSDEYHLPEEVVKHRVRKPRKVRASDLMIIAL